MAVWLQTDLLGSRGPVDCVSTLIFMAAAFLLQPRRSEPKQIQPKPREHNRERGSLLGSRFDTKYSAASVVVGARLICLNRGLKSQMLAVPSWAPHPPAEPPPPQLAPTKEQARGFLLLFKFSASSLLWGAARISGLSNHITTVSVNLQKRPSETVSPKHWEENVFYISLTRWGFSHLSHRRQKCSHSLFM